MLRLKLLVVGAIKSGKTNLITQYCKYQFTAQYKHTIGADYSKKTIDEEKALDIWDTGDPEDPYLSALLRNADVVLLCVDLSNDEKKIRADVQSNVKNIRDVRQEVPILLVGTKCDTLDPNGNSVKEKTELLNNLAKENKIQHVFVTSAKESTQVATVFFQAISDGLSSAVHRLEQEKKQNTAIFITNCTKAIGSAQKNYQKQGSGFFTSAIPERRKTAITDLQSTLATGSSPREKLFAILQASINTKKDHEEKSVFARWGITGSRLARELDNALDILVGIKADQNNELFKNALPETVNKDYVKALHCVDILLAEIRKAGRDSKIAEWQKKRESNFNFLRESEKECFNKISNNEFNTPADVAKIVSNEIDSLVDQEGGAEKGKPAYDACRYLQNALEKMADNGYITLQKNVGGLTNT